MYLQAYLIGSTYLGNIHNLTGKCTFSLYTLSDDTVQQVLKHTHTHRAVVTISLDLLSTDHLRIVSFLPLTEKYPEYWYRYRHVSKAFRAFLMSF